MKTPILLSIPLTHHRQFSHSLTVWLLLLHLLSYNSVNTLCSVSTSQFIITPSLSALHQPFSPLHWPYIKIYWPVYNCYISLSNSLVRNWHQLFLLYYTSLILCLLLLMYSILHSHALSHPSLSHNITLFTHSALVTHLIQSSLFSYAWLTSYCIPTPAWPSEILSSLYTIIVCSCWHEFYATENLSRWTWNHVQYSIFKPWCSPLALLQCQKKIRCMNTHSPTQHNIPSCRLLDVFLISLQTSPTPFF